MLLLASASQTFLARWVEILAHTNSVVIVDSLPKLKDVLEDYAAELIVLDMMLEGGKDPTVLRSISEAKKGARLIFSGNHFTPATELLGLSIGAVACCCDSMSIEECQRILGIVKQGGVWLSSAGIPELVAKLRDVSVNSRDVTPSPGPESEVAAEASLEGEDVLGRLTKRERQVAQYVSNGASNKDVARTLHISERTVKAHLSAIFEKLELQDRFQLALLLNRVRTIRRGDK